MSPRAYWLFPAAIVVATVLLLMPLPGFIADIHTLAIGAIHDLAHFPIFATVGFLACRQMRASRVGQFVLIMIAIGMFSAVMELAQAFIGDRDPSWFDLSTNTLGATAGVAIWVGLGARGKPHARRQTWLAGAAAIAAGAAAAAPAIVPIRIYFAQAASFPILYSASFPGTTLLAESLGALDEVDLEVVDDALHVDLIAEEPVGIVLWKFHADWSGFESLLIDLENTEASELPLQLDVRDYASTNAPTDWFSARITLAANERKQIRIDLDDIAAGPSDRVLEIADVSLIALYRVAEGSDGFAVRDVELQ